MNLLGLSYKILGWNKLTYSKQFKRNIKYKEIDNEAQDFYVENPHKLLEIKNH